MFSFYGVVAGHFLNVSVCLTVILVAKSIVATNYINYYCLKYFSIIFYQVLYFTRQ